jgi:hypothetical protein
MVQVQPGVEVGIQGPTVDLRTEFGQRGAESGLRHGGGVRV